MADYINMYMDLPEEAQAALAKADIEPIHVDVDLYVDQFPTAGSSWAQEASANAGACLPESHYLHLYEKIYNAALRIKRTRTDTSLRLHMAKDKEIRANRTSLEDHYTAPQKAAKCYKHWSRSRHKGDKATMRQIEDALRVRWIERLLDNLLPIGNDLPYMHKYRGSNERLKWRALFGVTRWGTVKHHCLSYEKITSILLKQALPWTDASITEHLTAYKTSRRSANQLRNYWNTIRYLSRTFGLEDPAEQEDLKNIYNSILDDLIEHKEHHPRKAAVPPMTVIRALEDTASDTAKELSIRYAAASFRWALGTSARFDDMQHCSPRTWTETSYTLEAKPWQTKTLHRGSTTRHKVLISTKHSFTGKQWWKVLTTVANQFKNKRPHMDYILPQPGSLYQGFLDRPCTYSTALKWLRHILIMAGVPRQIAEAMTLHSLRLWMAEMAYRAKIPRDRRKCIGQWAQEATADVYTRDHRSVYTNIWNEVTSKLADLQTPLLETKPSDPLDDYYMANDDTGPPEGDLRDRTPTKEAPELHCTDEYPESKGGPLTVAINLRMTGRGDDRCHRIHYFRTDGRAICNRNYFYRPENAQLLSNATDWKAARAQINTEADPPRHANALCKVCSIRAQPPTEWQHAYNSNTDDEAADTSSSCTASQRLTDEENDTESDEDALHLRDDQS